jgi:DNA invertase Pin-like site-specific DNA recombinase
MRAATYARKSTAAEKHEDGKSVSVATQRDNARRYVEKSGGLVVAEYEDDARSGADFTRPGLAALLAAAERREFDTLVVADRSRIGRDQIETPRTIHRLTTLGVTIVSYEPSVGVIARPNAKPIELFMGQVSDYASAEFRANIKVRARAGLVRTVEKGHHAGGPPPYGYRLVAERIVDARGSELPGPSKLVIDDEQARIIRALFTMCADGHGLTKSAKTLNGEERYATLTANYFGGTLPPCPGYLISPTKYTKPNNWCGTAIRAMLDNPIYAGKQRWGAMENYEENGRVHLRRKADTERVLLVDVPHLRIISPELEARVAKRRKAAAAHYAARKPSSAPLFGGPESGTHSQFLLSGLMRCSVCGGAMIVTSYTRRGRKSSRYLCSRRNKRGEQTCTNTRRVPLAELEAMVLAEFQKLLTPERIEQVTRAAMAKARERRRERPDEGKRIKAEIAELRREYDNFMRAIGAGKAPAGVMARLKTLEAQIATKEQLLEGLAAADVVNFGDARLMRVLRSNLERFTERLTSKNVPAARQALRRLLGGTAIQFTPIDGGGYELAAMTRLGPLFEGMQRDLGAGGGT